MTWSILGLVLLATYFFVSNSSFSVAHGQHIVHRAVDGDTLLLRNGDRVRLIGVDTPETKHPNKPVEFFGKEAAAFTKRLAEGKRVKLEYDQANTRIGTGRRWPTSFSKAALC